MVMGIITETLQTPAPERVMSENSGAGDPLHGITLDVIINTLVERHGWDELGQLIDIRCFQFDPSLKSSLKFLRRTAWARKKVEDLYLYRPPR